MPWIWIPALSRILIFLLQKSASIIDAIYATLSKIDCFPFRFCTATHAGSPVIRRGAHWRPTIWDHREAAGNRAAARDPVAWDPRAHRYATTTMAKRWPCIAPCAKLRYALCVFVIVTPRILTTFCRWPLPAKLKRWVPLHRQLATVAFNRLKRNKLARGDNYR